MKKFKDTLIVYEDIIFAYIFGSYSRKSMRENSDIDIGIYLKDNITTHTYLDIKRELSEAVKREVDLIILNEATPLLKYEIYRNHRLLFTHDKGLENVYKVKTLF